LFIQFYVVLNVQSNLYPYIYYPLIES
jgi:hypothetical protein